ncbi:MAG: mannose-6-phosphate isomerase, class I [Terrimonas sp.]|nr:mannose-6-phosphate isomerase, class I [Terrimonas sp.]
MKKGIYRLEGTIQHYDWGGTDYLPGLLGIINTSKKNYAEYWMGTHPKSPSQIRLGDELQKLDTVTAIPFLLKVLDVKDMLSIQVHPSKMAAALEFAKENADRIPLDAPHRNYKDDNHKPELAYAISEFWLLHGFKPEDPLRAVLRSVPEFESLIPVFELEGYEGLYKKVMGMPQEQVNACLTPLLDRIVPLYEKGVLRKEEEDYWAARAAITFNRNGQTDRGIFSVYFFNIVKLNPGEAIFQEAGIPHAYLFGQCVEIMANSDNVLRGGLTTKHIDVKELLKHTKCDAVIPAILKGTRKDNFEKVFETTAPDFELAEIRMEKMNDRQAKTRTDEILFVLQGVVDLSAEDHFLSLIAGEAAFVAAGTAYHMRCIEKSLVFRASAPVNRE